jgi:hypothetical protein
MAGRPYLAGANSTQIQMGQLLSEMSRLESLWGSFVVWVKHPETAEIESLTKALQEHEHDSEEFLLGLRRGGPRSCLK